MVSDGLKGSGDYGVFALGIYNGQTANRPELNVNRHIVSRFSYPFQVKNQIVEAGVQAYKGKYTLLSTSSGVKYVEDKLYDDERVGGTFVLYPKPFGILAEYNVGRGPEFDKFADSITTQSLSGGFVTASYKMNFGDQTLIPFVRYQKYKGGKKHEIDARSYRVEELEIGYSLMPKHRGKGFATEAAIKCKLFAFESTSYSSLISTVHIENEASSRVAIANGMTLEKTTLSEGDQVNIYRVFK